MTERLAHQRSKGPVSTPAQRLVELQNELTRTQQLLVEAQTRISTLETDWERYHSMRETSFGGIPMAQIYADLLLWEAILNHNAQLKAVYELGTWEGGFASWLWAQCQARDLHFATYDMVPSEHKKPPMYQKLDVFADRGPIGEIIRDWEPCIVFCDNGNKPREMAEYSLEIRDPASLLVVHDWGTEFLPADVPDGVEEMYGQFCDEIGSITRVFRRRM